MRLNAIWVGVTAVFLTVITVITAVEVGWVTDSLQDGDRSAFDGRI